MFVAIVKPLTIELGIVRRFRAWTGVIHRCALGSVRKKCDLTILDKQSFFGKFLWSISDVPVLPVLLKNTFFEFQFKSFNVLSVWNAYQSCLDMDSGLRVCHAAARMD